MEKQTLNLSGENLIVSVAILIRTAQIYEINNATFIHQIKRVHNALRDITSEGIIDIEIKGNHIFINGERIKATLSSIAMYQYLINMMKEKYVKNIIFHLPCPETELGKIFYTFSRIKDNKDVFHHLEEATQNIECIEWIEFEEGEEEKLQKEKDAKKIAIKTFILGIQYLKETTESMLKMGKTNLRKARGIVRRFIELILSDNAYLIGLTTIKNYENYTLNHSINVCILSLSMGVRLGMDRKNLLNLGISALFHDIGKIEVPQFILLKPTPLAEEEMELIKRHPYRGVEILLEEKGLWAIPGSAIQGILEHHIRYDGTGYPEILNKKPSLLARIIKIADAYDASTTVRLYQKVPSTPYEAINIMWQKAGRDFDPILLRVFVNMVGVYPIGSVVEISSDDIGIVLDTPENPKLYRKPRVAIISLTTPGSIFKIRDLKETDDFIVKAINSADIDFDPSLYFTKITGLAED